MTNASETMSPKPFGGEHYSAASDTAVAHKAVMVLDLSCKRQRQCSPPANDSNDSPVSSPYREGTSDYLENKHEANNNDRGHVNNYNHQASKEQQQQIRPIHPVPSSNYHQAYQECQERKSPESRSSMLTPPSDIESPKKVKLESSQANHMTADEMQLHASFQHFLASDSLPVKLPMSVPSAQSAASSVQTSIAGGGFAPSVPGLPYMPAAMLPNILGMSPSSSGLVPDIPTSTSPTASQISAGSQDESKKVPRPFKAYPKDPLSISITSDMMFDPEVKQSYYDFRNRMLDSVKKTNEGTNIKMRRVSKSPTLPTSTLDDKDAAYWERRRKNNEAAKRSRDARRAKEDEIAIKAAFLEQEYLRLKCENSLLKEEITRMKYLSYRH